MAIFEGACERAFVAPSPSCPILNTLAAMLFRGTVGPLFSSCPPPPFQPTSGRRPLLQGSWGSVSCVLSPGGALVIRTSSGWLYTAPRHLSPQGPCCTEPRQRRVTPTAISCGGTEVFTFCGAPAPRPGGGCPPRRCLCCTSYPLPRSAPGRLP